MVSSSSPQAGGILNSRLLRRAGLPLVGLLVFAAAILALVFIPTWPSGYVAGLGLSRPNPEIDAGVDRIEPVCTFEGGSVSPFKEIHAKYSHLRDDKFTYVFCRYESPMVAIIPPHSDAYNKHLLPWRGADCFRIVMQTYQRPKELSKTLGAITAQDIPSLHEVVVVWNDLETVPPEDYTTTFGVPVRYRRSKHNSLNEKLIPDPDFETQAVLLTDDDVYYKPSDLEFVFQSWRKFGQLRLVGALPRCSKLKNGKWEYTFCSEWHADDGYTLVLTNLCFSHLAFLDYYSSNAPEAIATRAYVDEHFNCEDIALNFVASKLTGYGPLEVNGHDRYVNQEPGIGISRKTGHMAARSQCLQDLEEIFGCMPLVEETARIQRGIKAL
jgi:hypothetical protein